MPNWEDITGLMKELMDKRSIDNFMKTVSRCATGDISDFTQELWINKRGEKCWLPCKGHAILNDKGHIEKIIGILTDITNNKKMKNV